jgi:hypothetical protein
MWIILLEEMEVGVDQKDASLQCKKKLFCSSKKM